MKMVGISILTAALLLSCSSTAGEEQVVNPGDDSGLGKKPKTEVLVMSSNIRQSTTDPGVLSWAGRKDAYLAMIKDTCTYLKKNGRQVFYDAEHFFTAFAISPMSAVSSSPSADSL